MIRPMLACKEWHAENLRFPVLVQPKYDGVRAIVRDGIVYGRSGKSIANQHVQSRFGHLNGHDGELVAAELVRSSNCCRITTSIVNSKSDNRPVAFIAYDNWIKPGPYAVRTHGMVIANTHLVNSPAELEAAHLQFVQSGYEGTIVRSPDAPYKNGRSTGTDMALLALKDFTDTEAVIVDVCESTELPQQMGSLLCQSPKWDFTFGIGTGFTPSDRRTMWTDRKRLVGQTVRFKHMPHGAKDRPRHPVFITFRSTSDL